jgi:hypothetical protein
MLRTTRRGPSVTPIPKRQSVLVLIAVSRDAILVVGSLIIQSDTREKIESAGVGYSLQARPEPISRIRLLEAS